MQDPMHFATAVLQLPLWPRWCITPCIHQCPKTRRSVCASLSYLPRTRPCGTAGGRAERLRRSCAARCTAGSTRCVLFRISSRTLGVAVSRLCKTDALPANLDQLERQRDLDLVAADLKCKCGQGGMRGGDELGGHSPAFSTPCDPRGRRASLASRPARPPPPFLLQGCLAHKKHPTPKDHHRAMHSPTVGS